MNRIVCAGFICSLLLIFLTGICTAADNPSFVGYIQGGESIITTEPAGMTISVQDVIPYFHKSGGNTEGLFPLERLTRMRYPMDAALVLSGADNESTSMIEITSLSLTDDNKTLMLHVTPLPYYEGALLKSFTGTQADLSAAVVGNRSTTQLYAEISLPVAENDCNYYDCCWYGYEWCCSCPR